MSCPDTDPGPSETSAASEGQQGIASGTDPSLELGQEHPQGRSHSDRTSGPDFEHRMRQKGGLAGRISEVSVDPEDTGLEALEAGAVAADTAVTAPAIRPMRTSAPGSIRWPYSYP